MLENVLRDLLKVRLIEVLKRDNGVDEILSIVREINSYNEELDDLDYQENDEYFFNTYFENNIMEAIRACYFGNYDYNDAYVKFDTYGNLESAGYFELEKELKNSINDITNEIIKLKNDISYNNTLKNIINEYEKIEEIYDILDNEIDEGFESNIECVVDDFYNILESVNDGFSLDIDIEANYNCIPTYKFILSLNYEEDDIEVIYIFDFEEDDKNNITFLEIEDVKINEI